MLSVSARRFVRPPLRGHAFSETHELHMLNTTQSILYRCDVYSK